MESKTTSEPKAIITAKVRRWNPETSSYDEWEEKGIIYEGPVTLKEKE